MSLLKKYKKKYLDVNYESVDALYLHDFYEKVEIICLKDEYGNLHSYSDAPSFILSSTFCLFGKKIINNLEIWHKHGKYIKDNFEEKIVEVNSHSVKTSSEEEKTILGLFPEVSEVNMSNISEEDKKLSDSVFREISLSSFPPGTYGYWKHNNNKLNKEELEEYHRSLEEQEKKIEEEIKQLNEKNTLLEKINKEYYKTLEDYSKKIEEEKSKNIFLEDRLKTLKEQKEKLEENLNISSKKIEEQKQILLELRKYHYEIESKRQNYQEIKTANLEKDEIILELEKKIDALEKRDTNITIKDLLLEVKDLKLVSKISFGVAGLFAALFLGFSFLF